MAEALADLKSRWPDLKLAKQTLRTALLALNFVEETRGSDPYYARTLEGLPAIVVETLQRWHRYDPAEAKRHAEEYAEGKHSVRSLMDAESTARTNSVTGGRSGRAGRSRFEENLAESILDFLAVGTDLRVKAFLDREPEPSERDRIPPALLSKVTLGTLLLDEPAPSRLPDVERFEGALLVAGPYADAETAAVRLPDWILRTLGLLFYFEEVALVLASGPAPTGFAHLIPIEAQHRILLLAPPESES